MSLFSGWSKREKAWTRLDKRPHKNAVEVKRQYGCMLQKANATVYKNIWVKFARKTKGAMQRVGKEFFCEQSP